jgi:hypothetical protein
MKSMALLALLTLLLQVPAAVALDLPHGPLMQAEADLFSDLDVADLSLATPCAGGVMERDAAAGAFRFLETDEPYYTPANAPPGYFRAGCGQASLEAAVPSGTHHVHLRFWASRTVSEFRQDPVPFDVSSGVDFNQSVQVFFDGASTPALEIAYFAADAASQPDTYFDLPSVLVPNGTVSLRVVWVFRDDGAIFPTTATLPNPDGGMSAAAQVRGVHLEYSSIPLEVAGYSLERSRVGDGLQRQMSASIVVPPDLLETYRVDARIRVDSAFQFSRMVDPSGGSRSAFGTRFEDGPDGFNRNLVLQERRSDLGYTQVTIPDAMTQVHGAGVYTFVLQEFEVLEAQPGLLVVAVLLLLAPLPLAVMAFLRIRRFHREAFGGFRRAASGLQVLDIAGVAFYLVIALSAFAGGRIGHMVRWPMSVEGVILYVQALVALAVFGVLYVVAHHLDAITRPPPAAAS